MLYKEEDRIQNALFLTLDSLDLHQTFSTTVATFQFVHIQENTFLFLLDKLLTFAVFLDKRYRLLLDWKAL